MTPRRAIARAPRASVTLTMAGSSSGEMPTASATANSSDSSTGRSEQLIDRQDEQHHDDHDAHEQVAELPDAARELGFGRPRLAGAQRPRRMRCRARS